MMDDAEFERRAQKFFDFVVDEAKKLGKVFVLDCGEGREMPNPPNDMYVEDFSGWLLTPEQAEAIPHETRDERDALFEDDSLLSVMARWDTDEDNQLIVRFEEVIPF